MAKTLTQQLTSAVVSLHNNLDDAEAAALVQKLAAEIGPKWATAKKPEALSLGRTAFVNGWIIQAGVDPVAAASNGEAAASALAALAVTLDPAIPPTWFEIWVTDGPLPPLADIGAAIASLAKDAAQAVTPGFGALPWIVGGLGIAWFLTRKRR